jgi:hypothetical protein
MTDEQLANHIGDIRRRKFIERPAKAKHESDAAKPERKARASKVTKLVGGMTDAEREELIKLLEG